MLRYTYIACRLLIQLRFSLASVSPPLLLIYFLSRERTMDHLNAQVFQGHSFILFEEETN
jgi:hypothetical protein